MTSLPADRFGLSNRGRLRPGDAADLVVFDPAKVADGATYDRPLDPPAGIVYVIVNGAIAIDNGKLTGGTSGHVLRRDT